MILAKNTDLKISNKTIIFLVMVNTILVGSFTTFIMEYCNKKIIDDLSIENSVLSSVLFLVFLYCFFKNFSSFCHFIWVKFFAFKVAKIRTKSVEKAFSYTIRHSMSYFNNSFSGDISSKISSIGLKLQNLIYVISKLTNNLIFLIMSMFICTKINNYIGISFLTYIIIYLILYKIFFLGEYYKAQKILAENNNRYFGLVNDVFMNIINVKSFSKTNFEKHNSNKHILSIQKNEKNITKLNLKMKFFGIFCEFIKNISIFLVSSILLSLNKITPGDFIMVLALKPNIESILQCIKSYYSAMAKINNSIEKLYQPIEITDKTEKELILTDGMIKFNNITFGYKNK